MNRDEFHFCEDGWTFVGTEDRASADQPGPKVDRFERDSDVLEYLHFPSPDEDPFQKGDLPAQRQFYRILAAENGGGMVSSELRSIKGIQVFVNILKYPQTPSGMCYEGSIVVSPGRAAHTILITCRETGMTGLRETIVVEKLHQQGVQLDVEQGFFGRLFGSGNVKRWARDPYDPEWDGEVLRTLSDAASYDPDFPEHPLTRVRKDLATLLESMGGNVFKS